MDALLRRLTAAIESVQFFVLNRSADITDTLMNGLGGIAGFVLARVFQGLVRLSPPHLIADGGTITRSD